MSSPGAPFSNTMVFVSSLPIKLSFSLIHGILKMSRDNSFSFAYTITIFLLVLSRTPASTNAGPIDFDVYSAKNDPDCFHHTPQLIESRGFVSETHHVTTADGYILTLFRIVNPDVNETERKRPIILQHGLLSS